MNVVRTRLEYSKILYYVLYYIYVILATYRQNYIDRLVPLFDWY